MLLDLKKIGAEGLTVESDLRLPDLETAQGERAPVMAARLTGAIRKGKGSFDFDARLDARVRLACSRCLEPVDVELSPRFHLTLVPTDDNAAPSGTPDDDADRLECPEGRLDLVDAAAEQIYLHLPLKPVCEAACRGLCPSCGANRNQTTCACATRAVDPRLAALLDLKRSRGD
jgi:uncharacterized protein